VDKHIRRLDSDLKRFEAELEQQGQPHWLLIRALLASLCSCLSALCSVCLCPWLLATLLCSALLCSLVSVFALLCSLVSVFALLCLSASLSHSLTCELVLFQTETKGKGKSITKASKHKENGKGQKKRCNTAAAGGGCLVCALTHPPTQHLVCEEAEGQGTIPTETLRPDCSMWTSICPLTLTNPPIAYATACPLARWWAATIQTYVLVFTYPLPRSSSLSSSSVASSGFTLNALASPVHRKVTTSPSACAAQLLSWCIRWTPTTRQVVLQRVCCAAEEAGNHQEMREPILPCSLRWREIQLV